MQYGTSQIIQFPNLLHCVEIPKDIKDSFKEKLDISDSTTKWDSLLKYSKAIISLIKVKQELEFQNHNFDIILRVILRILSSFRSWIVLVINVLLLYTFKHPDYTMEITIEDPNVSNSELKSIFIVLNTFTLICTFLLFIKWIYDFILLLHGIKKQKISNEDLIDSKLSTFPSYLGLILYSFSKSDLAFELTILLLLIFSFSHSELLVAFILILIIFRLNVFKNFWRAIMKSIGKLVILELLIYTGIYAFTVVAFYASFN